MAQSSSFVAPALIKRFSHAAAGHDGVLRDESGALLIKPCLPKEVAFYESAAAHPAFAKWMPTFMGTLKLGPPEAPAATTTDAPTSTSTGDAPAKKPLETSIVLSNLTYGFTRPCVLDVKLGAQLWDNEAPLEKRARLDEVANTTTSRPLGMRIAGMKVWKGASTSATGSATSVVKDGYEIYDKNYGRTFTAETALAGFQDYLFKGELSAEQSKLIAARFAAKVAQILDVLEHQESRMYSASLLFVYEGDVDALDQALVIEKQKKPDKGTLAEAEADEEDDDDEEDENAPPPKKVEDLKLIDFAHASWTPGEGPDLNSIHGVKSVLALLQQLT
ncbi:hypothetical protein TWF696_002228 [Orbilia brochopaga]|uniref:Kinase n=1 Tax=Orbilia brochopaga TaxID=3140254 RepID=A0AAV9U3P5_9PEZI